MTKSSSPAPHRVTLSGELRPRSPGCYTALLIRACTANGLTFGPQVLRLAAPLFEGVPAFVDHAPGGRSVRDMAGLFDAVYYDDDAQAVYGRLKLFPQAAWLGEMAAEVANPAILGLSAVLWVQRDRQNPAHVARIESVESCDIVVRPAAGGAILAPQPTPPAPAASALAQGEVMSTENPAEPAPQQPKTDALRQLTRENARLKIEASGLPEPLRVRLQQRYLPPQSVEGTPEPAQPLDAAIAEAREALAAAAESQTVRHLGPLSTMRTPLDRIEAAFGQLMGLPQSDAEADVARLSGIRELYDTLTGDWERRGLFVPQRVTLANATTTTMAEVTRNVLNKALLQAYNRRPHWWQPIAHEEDFATLQPVRWVSLGGFSDLSPVAEGAAYTEKTWDDTAETATFIKTGNYIGLTLEMIDRDDVAAVRAIPQKLGLAAWRTLSSAVSALFTANEGLGPVLSDSHNLFDAAHHGNLASAELSADNWQATTEALFKQSEYGSAKRLGVRPRYCLIPIELERTALEIFTSDVVPTESAFYRNVLRRNAECVIVVPEWTDAVSWAAAADPADLEGVCIGYRYGRAPELFVADSPLMGSMFTNDEMRIKVRFVYALGVGDYRALFKHNVSSGS